MFALLLMASLTHSDMRVSFDELVSSAASYDGKEIEVEGWFRGCFRTRCALFRNETGPDHRSLTISPDSPVYSELRNMEKGEIRIVARFDAACVSSPCGAGGAAPLSVSSFTRIERD